MRCLFSSWRRRHGWEVEATGVVTDSLRVRFPVLTVPLLPFTAASVPPPRYYDMDSVSSRWDKEKPWPTDQWLALYVLSVMTVISGRKNKKTKKTRKTGQRMLKTPMAAGKHSGNMMYRFHQCCWCIRLLVRFWCTWFCSGTWAEFLHEKYSLFGTIK